MKSRTKITSVSKPMKLMAFIFSLFFVGFIIQSCTNDILGGGEKDRLSGEIGLRSGIGSDQEEEAEFAGVDCNGKKILVFNSLVELQQEHLNLYDQYFAANEEEDILIDYENNINFYSLRKKEHEMDDGIIPYDPDFDETEYTFDAVFETLLNQDGMIIIDDRLYLWSSGCVVHSVPFSCDNYLSLLQFRDAVLNDDAQLMYQLMNDLEMINTNTCDELQYDFDYVSSNGGYVDDKDIPSVLAKNGCGYTVNINTELIACDMGRYIFEVTYVKQQPLGTGAAINNYLITSAFGDIDDLAFSGSFGGTYTSAPVVVQGQTIAHSVFFESTFYMSTPQTAGMQVVIELESIINAFSGNSCIARDTKSIDLTCPAGIVGIPTNINEHVAEWQFTFPTNPACGIQDLTISWDFGDGSPTQMGGSVNHEYIQTCLEKTYTVSAHVSGQMCGQQASEQLFTFDVNVGGSQSCNRQTYKFPTYKAKVSGKRIKLASRIKKRNSKAIFKSVFKARWTGDKTITSTGNVYAPTANNSGPCNIINIASIVPSKTKSGKSRNKQKVKVYSINQINALDPYEVNFTHSNGFTHTLFATDLYCSQ